MGLLQSANELFNQCSMPKIEGDWPKVAMPKHVNSSYDKEISWPEAHGATMNEEGEWDV